MKYRWCLLMICFALLPMLGSCLQQTYGLTQEGAAIQLIENPEDYPQCSYLGSKKAMALIGLKNSYQQAMNKIKNSVSFSGGTHLKIIASETDDLTTTIQGEAYKCPLTAERQIQGPPANKESWMIIE